LIGLSGASVANSPAESLSQPTHLRTHTSAFLSSTSSSSSSFSSSPEFDQILPNRATGATPIPIHHPHPTMTTPIGLPIPRSNNAQQTQRRLPALSTATSSSTTSPSSSLPPSPFTFSPSNHQLTHEHESSYNTQATTPPSSTSPFPIVPGLQGFAFQPLPQQLSYPSVPPPSLSSSLGSPVVSLSPNVSRRNSVGQGQGHVPGGGGAVRRRMSLERGARVAETGSLVGRGRGGGNRIGE